MNEQRVAEIYDELGKLVVELDPDPVARGPAYLLDLISRVRGYLNHVSVYTQEAHRERHDLERRKDALQAAFDVEADRLLAEDGRVKRQPSIDDRKAMINLILTDERREIEQVGRELRSLGHVEKAVRHRQKELESTMSQIRLQRSLIAAEIRTGSFYGDESDKSRGDAWAPKKAAPDPDDIDELDEDELSSLLAQAEAQLTNGSDDEAEEDGEEAAEEPEVEEQPKADPDPAHDQELVQDLVAGIEEISLPQPEPKPISEPAEPAPDEDPDIENFLVEDDDEFGEIFDQLDDDS